MQFNFQYILTSGDAVMISCLVEAEKLKWGVTTPLVSNPLRILILLDAEKDRIDAAAHLEWMSRAHDGEEPAPYEA